MINEATKIYGEKNRTGHVLQLPQIDRIPSHLVAVKFVIFYLRKYIETNIKENGYTKESFIDEYVLELTNKIVRDIKEVDLRAIKKSKSLDDSKSLWISAYISKRYTKTSAN